MVPMQAQNERRLSVKTVKIFLSLMLWIQARVLTLWKPLCLYLIRIANSGLPTPLHSLFLRLLEALASAGIQLQNQRFAHMKSPSIENIVVDEVHQRTYVVMAHRVLTDGELYSAIRVEILKRGERLTMNERLVITSNLR
jgi:hypothetical protein